MRAHRCPPWLLSVAVLCGACGTSELPEDAAAATDSSSSASSSAQSSTPTDDSPGTADSDPGDASTAGAGTPTDGDGPEDGSDGGSADGPAVDYDGCGADPDCLFSANFDAMDDWEACTEIECSAGQVCRVNAWGASPDDLYGCTDHPLSPERCEGCDPVPDNWSVYRSETVSGAPQGRSCRIGAQTVAGLGDRSGDGKMFIHRVGRNPGNSANDCALTWWDADEQWPELWTIYSFRADPAAREFFASDRLGAADHDMKHVRIGHYKGDGTNGTVGFWNFNFEPYSHANAGVFIRKNNPQDDFFFSMQARCYTQHAGGQCEPYQFYDESPNLRSVRACVDEPNNPFMDPGAVPGERNNVRTCAPAVAGSPWPSAQLDVSQCTNDQTCTDGALIEDGSFGGAPDKGDGFDHFMAGSVFDGQWHTLMFRARVNSSAGATDGLMELYMDGILFQALEGSPFFDAGTPDAGTFGVETIGWNWAMLGGNTRGSWLSGFDLPDEINFAFDDWCVASTREAAERCHAAFLGIDLGG
ncbi:MAG: hypothetical protein AAF721_18760 [Myxococcota bacterium]